MPASRAEIAAAAKKVSDAAEAAATLLGRRNQANARAAQAQAVADGAQANLTAAVAAYDQAVIDLQAVLAIP